MPEYVELFDTEGNSTQTLRLVVNQVGTVRGVVDAATGEVVQRLVHDEFGRVLFDTNGGFQPFGFGGGLQDEDTGLVRFGARDYDVFTGRWTERDPVGFAGGQWNLLTYVDGAVGDESDPAGTSNPSIGIGIGGSAIGGIVRAIDDLFGISDADRAIMCGGGNDDDPDYGEEYCRKLAAAVFTACRAAGHSVWVCLDVKRIAYEDCMNGGDGR